MCAVGPGGIYPAMPLGFSWLEILLVVGGAMAEVAFAVWFSGYRTQKGN